MARKSKLLSALDAHQGRDFDAEKQKKQRKAAEKRARAKEAVIDVQEEEDEEDEEDESVDEVGESLEALAETAATGDIPESGEDEEDEEDEEDVPLSDLESLSSNDKEDIVPHQRLTINNTTALMKSYNSIATPRSAPFSTHQSVTSSAQIEISDVHDDLSREQAFYTQALEASVEARRQLIKEGVPFTRPNDYFAEMVKTDEHMGKIKGKMVAEAAGRKAAAEARRQRDLKKFGKQVQVAKLQERDKARKETLDRIGMLKRKRKGADIENPTEDDRFDVTLEDAAESKRSGGRRDAGANGRPAKRQKKDAKFGFGGKKRFSKSNDAGSSGDMRGFSVKKMKGKPKGAAKRLGKSRRAKSS